MVSSRLIVRIAILVALVNIYTGAYAIKNRLDYRMCRNPLNIGFNNPLADPDKPHLDNKKYIQINFNIVNSEGMKGFIRSKALDRLIYGLMEDLHCAGMGEMVSIMYSMPFWDDVNEYDKSAVQLTTNVPQYYTDMYYNCDFEYYSTYYTSATDLPYKIKYNTKMLKSDQFHPQHHKPLTFSLIKNAEKKQALCPKFSYKYPYCDKFDKSAFYNLNSTKPFKRAYSEDEHYIKDEECPGIKDQISKYHGDDPRAKKRDKLIQSPSAIYGSGYMYGSRPSLLLTSYMLNTPGTDIDGYKKIGFQNSGYPANYAEQLRSIYDQDDERASFLDSHTYTGGSFYDGRTELDYNHLFENVKMPTNVVYFRLPPFDFTGYRPIYEQFSFQFNLRRDLLASFAYANDARIGSHECNSHAQRVDVLYDDAIRRPVEGPIPPLDNIDNYVGDGYNENVKLMKLSKFFDCWGDESAIQILITVVCDEPQDYSSNLDIMWRMHKASYEIAGPGGMGERIRGRERATGHKYINFNNQFRKLTDFPRQDALESLARSIVHNNVRHIVLVVDSKDSTPHTTFVKRDQAVDLGFPLPKDKSFYEYKKKKLFKPINRTRPGAEMDSDFYVTSNPITALDYIIGYHGANVYSKETRRLDIKRTLHNLDTLSMDKSLQSMVLNNDGYFSVISVRDLHYRPLLSHSYRKDKLSLFDLVESAAASIRNDYMSPTWRKEMWVDVLTHYKHEFKVNNRTPVKRPLHNPMYNTLYGDVVPEIPQPTCGQFDDIEDLVTHILLNTPLYGSYVAGMATLLMSLALNNMDRFSDYFFEVLPLGKLMETYYHEPVFILPSEYLWDSYLGNHIDNLCSDKTNSSFIKDSVKQAFDDMLLENDKCNTGAPQSCMMYAFVMTLVNHGFDTYTYRPNYKLVLKAICAEPSRCEGSEDYKGKYFTKCITGIETCNTSELHLNPYGIRTRLDTMRTLSIYDYMISNVDPGEFKSEVIRMRSESFIPDSVLGNPCGIYNSTACTPDYVKDAFDKREPHHFVPHEYIHAYERSTSCVVPILPLDSIQDYTIPYATISSGCSEIGHNTLRNHTSPYVDLLRSFFTRYSSITPYTLRHYAKGCHNDKLIKPLNTKGPVDPKDYTADCCRKDRTKTKIVEELIKFGNGSYLWSVNQLPGRYGITLHNTSTR